MKELILKERETKEKIVQVVNESGLPAFILKPILKEFYEQVVVLEENQYQQALNSKQEEKKGTKKEATNGKN